MDCLTGFQRKLTIAFFAAILVILFNCGEPKVVPQPRISRAVGLVRGLERSYKMFRFYVNTAYKRYVSNSGIIMFPKVFAQEYIQLKTKGTISTRLSILINLSTSNFFTNDWYSTGAFPSEFRRCTKFSNLPGYFSRKRTKCEGCRVDQSDSTSTITTGFTCQPRCRITNMMRSEQFQLLLPVNKFLSLEKRR